VRAEDFAPRPAASLIAYAQRCAPGPAPSDFAMLFMPYEWTVPHPPPALS
jgi:hypothetical protein